MVARDGSVRYVTNSEMQTFKRCRRKWYFAYWRKITPIEEQVTGVRSLGTRIHRALAAMYTTPEKSRDPMTVLEDDYQQDRLTLIERKDQPALEELEKDMGYARAMVEGYIDWLAEEGADVGLEIVDSEKEVSAPLLRDDVPAVHGGVPIHLLGRLDVQVVRELDGARMFLDHKSVGSFSQATAMLHMDEQMQMYTLLQILEQLARGVDKADLVRCDGGIYNMIRRVKRTARAKPPFYARETVQFNDEQIRNFFRHVHAVIGEICVVEERLQAGSSHQDVCPPSPRSDCAWSCDYKHVCPMMDDGSYAEGLISASFKCYDPLDRYADCESGLSEGETE